MSRIGKKPITLTDGVTVKINDSIVTVKGPKGELNQEIGSGISVKEVDGELVFERSSDSKDQKALHGLYRSLVANAVEGVTKGFEKKLELVGVGYKATATNGVLELNLGYSHSIFFQLPTEVSAKAETVKGQNPIITLESIDKELIGQVAAKIRTLRKVEPFKGKGIRFVGEQIRRKAGKTAAK